MGGVVHTARGCSHAPGHKRSPLFSPPSVCGARFLTNVCIFMHIHLWRRARRDLPWGLRGQSSHHAVQAGSHSNQHLRLDGESMAITLASLKKSTPSTCRHWVRIARVSNFLPRPDFRSYVLCACRVDRARDIAPSFARSRAFVEDAPLLPPGALRCPEDRTRRKGVSGAGYMIVGGG